MRRILLTAAVALLVAAPAAARNEKIIFFGDSITFGYYDGTNSTNQCYEDLGHPPEQCGYPGRVASRLNNQGYEVFIYNKGEGGEATVEGVSRLNTLLNQIYLPDYLSLMEGTNDISRGYSIETAAFNLQQMGNNAESHGLRVVLGTVIQRWPNADVDPDNVTTQQLNELIRDLAASEGWTLVDTYAHFATLPNLFADYYQTWEPNDPVGHPKRAGYDQLANVFTPALRSLMPPRFSLSGPTALTTGDLATYTATSPDVVVTYDWDLSDGVQISGPPPGAATAQHIYLEPGTYPITVAATGTNGAVRNKDLTLTVTGTAVTVPTRLSLAPFVARGTAAAPDNLRAQLQVVNPGGQPLLAFLRYLPEPTIDPLPFALDEIVIVPGGAAIPATTMATALRESIPPPSPYPQVRVWVPAATTLTWTDAVADLFGGTDVDGAVEVKLFAPNGAPLAAWTSPVRLYQDGNPGGGADLADLVDTAWSGAPRTVTGIDDKLVDATVLSITNPGAYDISLVATLRDWSKAVVDTRLLGVLRGSTKTVTLEELFPTAGAAAGPLSLELALSGPTLTPFLADAAEIDPRGDMVLLLPIEP